MKVLGIDNVFFDVSNLEQGIAHYTDLGLNLRFAMQSPRVAIFAVGTEEPGLILREVPGKATPSVKENGEQAAGSPCFVWLEVADAASFRAELLEQGTSGVGSVFETGTGYTVEVRDNWGNKLGFADYLKRPELARALAV